MQARLEKVNISVDEERLAAALLMPATALPGVLFVHGWGDSKENDLARARQMTGLGCVCLTFDLRGHAESSRGQESVTREHNLRDLLAAYDTLVAVDQVDPASIAVIGISYGGYLATILTTLRPVRWLALRAPALYKDVGWDLPKRKLHQDPDFAAYRRRELPPDDNRALRASAAYRGDVLIVESAHDDVVPHATISNYVAAFSKAHSLTARVIDGADHALSDPLSQQSYTSILVSWISEMVAGARADALDLTHQGAVPLSKNDPALE
jgi:hypothetical protein